MINNEILIQHLKGLCNDVLLEVDKHFLGFDEEGIKLEASARTPEQMNYEVLEIKQHIKELFKSAINNMNKRIDQG